MNLEWGGPLTVTILIAIVLSLIFGLASLAQIRRRFKQPYTKPVAGPPYRVADPHVAPAPAPKPAAPAPTPAPRAEPPSAKGKPASAFRQLDERGLEVAADSKSGADTYIWE